MTENWRVKTATSFAVGFPPNSKLKPALAFFSWASMRRICSRLRASASACRLSAWRSPETVSPFRFCPLNVNVIAISLHLTCCGIVLSCQLLAKPYAAERYIISTENESAGQNDKAIRRGAFPAGAGSARVCAGGVQSESVLHSVEPEPDRPSGHPVGVHIPGSPDLRIHA